MSAEEYAKEPYRERKFHEIKCEKCTLKGVYGMNARFKNI